MFECVKAAMVFSVMSLKACGMTDEDIYEWLKAALSKTKTAGKSREGLAELLEVDVSQVARMLSSDPAKRRSISAGELFKIVQYLGEPLPIGDTTRYLSSSLVPVVGPIGAGVWHEPGYSWMQPAVRVPMVVEPTLERLPQHARRVEGTDFNKIFLYGDCPIFVPFWEVRKVPHDGDIVEVERTRPDNSKETSLRRVKVVRGGYELHHESNDPMWQDVVSIKDIHNLNDYAIIGLYVGMFRPVNI